MLIKQPITQFHADIAKKIFKDHIKGYVPNLDHMCVTLSYRPDENTTVTNLFDDDSHRRLLMLSPIDKIEDHYYNKTDYSKYDFGLSAKHYTKFTMYPWTDGTFGHLKNVIDKFKEDVYGLYSGHFFSIQLDHKFYLIFGIASHCKDPRMPTIFANNIFKIIEAGLAYYSYLRPVMASHVDYILPTPSDTLYKQYDREDYEVYPAKGIIFPYQPRVIATVSHANRPILTLVK